MKKILKYISKKTTENYNKVIFIVSGVILVTAFIIVLNSGKTDTMLEHRSTGSVNISVKDAANGGGLGGAYKPDTVNAPITYFEYTVKSGDSLSSIAREFGLDEVSIISLNNMKYVSLVSVGTILKVPNQDGLLVKAGGNIEAVATKYSFAKEDLLRINSLEDGQKVDSIFVPGVHMTGIERQMLLGEFFRRPAYGRFTSYFGYRRDPWTGGRIFHQGVDIANPNGGYIYAAAAGTVISVEWSWVYGNLVKIKHSSGYTSAYGHMSSVSVSPGQRVNAQQTIGTMGNTGRSTGTHLHFEIRQYGRVINPFRVTAF